MLLSWQSHIGKYLHKCDECGEQFAGPKNKLYCTSKCKAKRNNELAALNRKRNKELADPLLNNIEIIESELGNVEGEVLTVSMERMKARGFDPEAPSTRMMMDHETWYKLGSVAYRPDDVTQEFELYKIPGNE